MIEEQGRLPRAHRAFAAAFATAVSVLLAVMLTAVAGHARAYADEAQAQASAAAESAAAPLMAQSTSSLQASSGQASTQLTAAQKAAKKRKAKGKPYIAIVNKGGTGGLASFLKRAGCSVKLVTTQKGLNPSKFDGAAIPGGGDVTPKLYHAKRDKRTYGTSLSRDYLQIAAVKKFSHAGKPVLGICRGCQVINVAFGGTLKQHIAGWHRRGRTITIKKGSWLYSSYGKSEYVWHYHHQCVKKLGRGLYATEWDKRDKHIEAIEHVSLPVYGVQWHPDSMRVKGLRVAKKFRKECLSRM